MKTINYDRLIEAAQLLFLIALAVIALNSCKPAAQIARTDTITKTVIQEVVRDTTVYLTDSAGFRAALECDSLGRVRIKQIQDFYAGQFVKPTVVIKDNYVTLDCKVDSAAVYVTWKERNETTQEKITVVQVVKERYKTGFDWFQIWLGRVLILIIVVYAGIKLLKRYTSLKLPF